MTVRELEFRLSQDNLCTSGFYQALAKFSAIFKQSQLHLGKFKSPID